MDKTQLNALVAKHESLLKLNLLMETGDSCTLNKASHARSSLRFHLENATTDLTLTHNENGLLGVEVRGNTLRLSDKSRNALEAMSSTMATVVRSVLNEELEEMKKAFGEISIDGLHATEIDEEL